MPQYNGGCPIQGYQIYMNDGQDGPLTTLVNMNSQNPNLYSFTINIAGTVGNVYKFKVRVTNINQDFVETNALSVALASLPS